MAQGCHLIYSASDRDNFPIDPDDLPSNREESLQRMTAEYGLALRGEADPGLLTPDLKLDPARAVAHGVSSAQVETFTQRVRGMEPKDQEFVTGLMNARPAAQADLVRGLGNPALDPGIAHELPGALQILLRDHPNAPGLFEPAGADADSWVSTISHRGSNNNANGYAFEVLAAARLTSVPSNDLFISSTDHLDFGFKLQARYGSGTGGLNTPGGVFSQPDRRTTEADFLISRGTERIYVDTKFTGGARALDKQQLDGLEVALKTGEITQAHFVCNRSFSSGFTKLREVNERLEEAGCAKIELHEHYG